jgi:nuclear cap-binding protein subunit 1
MYAGQMPYSMMPQQMHPMANAYQQQAAQDDAYGDVNMSEQVELRLRALLARLGERSRDSLERNIAQLADHLEEEIQSHSELVLSTVVTCMKRLSAKGSIYGTLVGLLNARSADVGRQFVSRIGEALSESLAEHRRDESRLLLRAVAELTNAHVIASSSLMALFSQLLDTIPSQELDESRSDFIVYLVVSTLPFAGRTLSLEEKDAFGSLMNDVDQFMADRSRSLGSTLSVFPQQSAEEDLLANMWRALKRLRNENWVTNCFQTPYMEFSRQLMESTLHSFKLTAIPSQAGGPAFHLRPDLRIFMQLDSKKPQYDDIGRYVIGNYVADTFQFFRSSHKEAAKQIYSFPLKVDYREIVIETFFACLLDLPTPVYEPIFYGVVMCDLFKMAPKHIPPVLGRAVNYLFQQIGAMDLECRERMAEWLAVHLSNFNFLWPWVSWNTVLEQDKHEPQNAFVREVLDRCVRLSYWERIQKTLPDEFSKLMPDIPQPAFRFAAIEKKADAAADIVADAAASDAAAADIVADDAGADADTAAIADDASDAKVNDDNGSEQLSLTAQIAISSELMQLMRNKASNDEVQEFLESKIPTDTRSARLGIFFPTLLEMGKSSYSHFLAFLARYRNLIVQLVNSEDAQSSVVDSVTEYWQHAPQKVLIILDKLYTFNVIEATPVINWVFSMREHFNRSYIMEVLNTVIVKTLRRVEAIRRLAIKLEPVNDTSTGTTDDAEASSDATPSADDVNDESKEVKENIKRHLDIFLIVFQRFCMEMQADAPAGMSADEADRMKDAIEQRFTQFVRNNATELRPFLASFESLFTDSPLAESSCTFIKLYK